jgi:hypothetical protein
MANEIAKGAPGARGGHSSLWRFYPGKFCKAKGGRGRCALTFWLRAVGLRFLMRFLLRELFRGVKGFEGVECCGNELED